MNERVESNINSIHTNTINRNIVICFSILIIWLGVFYDTILSTVDIWQRSETFAHGFFIIPISTAPNDPPPLKDSCSVVCAKLKIVNKRVNAKQLLAEFNKKFIYIRIYFINELLQLLYKYFIFR